MSRPRLFHLAAAALCFLSGAMVYLLFRSRQLLGFAVLDAVRVGEWADALRGCVSSTDDGLPVLATSASYGSTIGEALVSFAIYSLPDGLWSLSYVLLIHEVFRRSPLRERLAWASVIPLLGAGSEVLQALHVLPGSYDTADLLCYLLPFIAYTFLQLCHSRTNK